MMQDKNGKPIGYSAYNPNTGNNILMKLEELSIFKASVENNLGYNIENTLIIKIQLSMQRWDCMMMAKQEGH
ncbi:hypothetical protein BSPWISOXPB_3893 [uncultured Gammaproteobacteria bacterium]|nr:hypothetical protein BSPWISOXPB_1811 [uncultured Gammaproteobacteria bacterium]VVM25123.1 hypothetical protein BSPWISOXPB_3893 [uncultured Gammaproteobacteria bacterium]